MKKVKACIDDNGNRLVKETEAYESISGKVFKSEFEALKDDVRHSSAELRLIADKLSKILTETWIGVSKVEVERTVFTVKQISKRTTKALQELYNYCRRNK